MFFYSIPCDAFSGWPVIFEMKIQEQFKNISILFKNTSEQKCYNKLKILYNKVFLKKLNLIITKDKYKYQEEQNYESLSMK